MSLPLELRDMIYTAGFESELASPMPRVDKRSGMFVGGKGRIHYDERIYYAYVTNGMWIASSVLARISRQINAESKMALSRLKKSGGLRYKLDCTIVNERFIYPTWCSVPALSQRIASVEFVLNLFQDSRLQFSTWFDNRFYAVGLSMCVFRLLIVLLTEWGFLSGKGLWRAIEINELVLNVVTPRFPIEVPFPTQSSRYESRGSGRGHLIDMHEVVGELERQITYWRRSGGSYLHDITYGKVKIIKLCLDGKEKQVHNLEAVAAKRSHTIVYSTCHLWVALFD